MKKDWFKEVGEKKMAAFLHSCNLGGGAASCVSFPINKNLVVYLGLSVGVVHRVICGVV